MKSWSNGIPNPFRSRINYWLWPAQAPISGLPLRAWFQVHKWLFKVFVVFTLQ